MALFSMRVQVIGRKAGRSAVASAAYRAGACLTDGKGNTADYRGKEHVELARIMAPEDAPEWVYDRGELWRRVEAIEKRKDSQLCREIRIMLPREFTPEQRVNVVTEFVQRQFVERGMVADVAWHNPKASDGQSNPHVHVMLTMRALDGDGFAKKTVKAEGRKKQVHANDWNTRELYEGIRKSWEDTANAVLADSGSAARIDRRSYVERGISQMPQPYLGVAQRMRILRDNMRNRYNQFIAYKASSRAWGFAKQALDAQMQKLDNRVEKVIRATDTMERFVQWVQDKTDALVQGVGQGPSSPPPAPGRGMRP